MKNDKKGDGGKVGKRTKPVGTGAVDYDAIVARQGGTALREKSAVKR